MSVVFRLDYTIIFMNLSHGTMGLPPKKFFWFDCVTIVQFIIRYHVLNLTTDASKKGFMTKLEEF